MSKNILNVVPLEYVCGVFGQDRILTRPVAILPVRGDLDKHRGNQMVYLQKHTLSNKNARQTHHTISVHTRTYIIPLLLPQSSFHQKKDGLRKSNIQ